MSAVFTTAPKFDAFLRGALCLEGIGEDDAEAALRVLTRCSHVERKLSGGLVGAGDGFDRLAFDRPANLVADRAGAGAAGERAIGAHQSDSEQDRRHLLAAGRHPRWAHFLLQISQRPASCDGAEAVSSDEASQ